MALSIDKSPRALADIQRLWNFIANESPSAADRLLRRIDKALTMLAEHPQAGRSRPELQPNLRSFPVGSYIVLYIPDHDRITLVRIIEGHRDLQSQFDEPD